MDDQDSSRLIPDYPVRFGEAFLVTLSAITLIGAALAGLGIKAIGNAFNPWRAEAIAKSLMDYTIPGGSRGIFGIKIGGAKIAWVRSQKNPPDVVLFVGKTPTIKEAEEIEQFSVTQNFETPPSDNGEEKFTVITTRTESKTLCNRPVSVTVDVGEQTFSKLPTPLPAIRYTARNTEDDNEQFVILTVNGQEAARKANNIFKSLRCK